MAADPSVSPADTPRRAQQHATHLLRSVVTWGGVKELIGDDLYRRSLLALRSLEVTPDELLTELARLREALSELADAGCDHVGGHDEPGDLEAAVQKAARLLSPLSDEWFAAADAVLDALPDPRPVAAVSDLEQLRGDVRQNKEGLVAAWAERDTALAAGERDRRQIAQLTEAAARALIAVEIAYKFILDARKGRVTEDWQGQQSAIALNELLAARAVLAGEEDAE